MILTKFGVPVAVAWLILVVYRGVFNASDQASRWALGVLTLAVLMIAVIALSSLAAGKVKAKRRGERVLTNSTVPALLLAVLVAGFVVRFVAGGDEPDGVVAWMGGVLGVLALAGLLIFGFLRERSRVSDRSFFLDPNWKYGLLLVAIIAMVVFALTESGVLASLAVLSFWLALLALVVRAGGRWFLLSRRRSASSSADSAS